MAKEEKNPLENNNVRKEGKCMWWSPGGFEAMWGKDILSLRSKDVGGEDGCSSADKEKWEQD